MIIAYVAGKYNAPTKEEKIKNVEKAEEIGKELLQMGIVPLIPHKITSLWDYDERFADWNADLWLERFCYPLLVSCDFMVVCDNHNGSYGVRKEIEYANAIGIPVIYYKSSEQLHEEIGEVLKELSLVFDNKIFAEF